MTQIAKVVVLDDMKRSRMSAAVMVNRICAEMAVRYALNYFGVAQPCLTHRLSMMTNRIMWKMI